MIARTKRSHRIVVSIMSLVLVFSASNFAAAEPEDTILGLLLGADKLSAIGNSRSTVFLSWQDNSTVETDYKIEMAISDELGPWTKVGQGPCQPLNAMDLGTLQDPQSLIDKGRMCRAQVNPVGTDISDPRTLYFRVTPLIQVNGTVLYEGSPSPIDPAILAPAPPSNVQCNGGNELSCVNVASITLTWQDNSDEQAFWIFRSSGVVNPGYGGVRHDAVGADITTWNEILEDFSTVYWYAVASVRLRTIVMLDGTVHDEFALSSSDMVRDGDPPNSGPGNVRVETPPIPPPTDPGGLTATFSPPSTATLTWSDPSQPILNPPYVDEDGWFIEMGTNQSTFSSQMTRQAFVGMSDPNHVDPARRAVTWVDKNVPPDTLRCYRVRAYRAAITPAAAAFSAYSPRTTADAVCVGSIPKPPTNLTATAISNTQVNLAWLDKSTTEMEFAVQRCTGTCTSSSTWTEVGTSPSNVPTFSDNNTIATTTYSYRVLARNTSGASAPSNIVTVTTKTAPLPKPTDLVATAAGAHAIELTWKDVAGATETGYKLEYRDGSQWFELKVLGQFPGSSFLREDGQPYPVPTYIDRDTLSANEERCYRVRALKNAGASDPSNVACATTGSALAPDGDPTGLSATPTTNTKVTLAWTDNATNEDNYRVEHVAFADRHCSQVSVTPGQIDDGSARVTPLTKAPARSGRGGTSYVVGGLTPHSSYLFRVVAVNQDGVSRPSNASACVQTFGPQKPIILDENGQDPQASGDTDAMRCEVRVRTLDTVGSDPAPHPVGRLRIWVNATVGEVAHTDTIMVPPSGSASPGTGGTLSNGAQWSVDSNGVWTVGYKFRKGPNYGIVVTAFQSGEPAYESAIAGVRDLKVLADCPLDYDPLPQT